MLLDFKCLPLLRSLVFWFTPHSAQESFLTELGEQYKVPGIESRSQPMCPHARGVPSSLNYLLGLLEKEPTFPDSRVQPWVVWPERRWTIAATDSGSKILLDTEFLAQRVSQQYEMGPPVSCEVSLSWGQASQSYKNPFLYSIGQHVVRGHMPKNAGKEDGRVPQSFQKEPHSDTSTSRHLKTFFFLIFL